VPVLQKPIERQALQRLFVGGLTVTAGSEGLGTANARLRA
jgi:hypothetical protein